MTNSDVSALNELLTEGWVLRDISVEGPDWEGVFRVSDVEAHAQICGFPAAAWVE